MPALKDYLGSTCPVCVKDILQPAPSIARMPPGEYAFCPSCESALSLDDLGQLARGRVGFFARLFRRPSRA